MNGIIQRAAMKCNNFQVAVLMKWVECKKRKKKERNIDSKMPVILALYFLKITSLKCYLSHATESCNRDRK